MMGNTRKSTWFGSTLAGGLALVLAACGDGVGPEGSGELNVLLTASSPSAQAVLASASAYSGTAGEISLADVESIDVEVSGLQAILASESEEDEGAWVDLALSSSASTSIDLLALPSNGLVIASDQVAAGNYSNLRIFFSSATISLANDVTVGTETFAAADNPHELFIPSGEQTGIKIPLFGVEVGAGAEADVAVAFDEQASVQTVAATGTGLLMSPVLGQEAEGQ